jgi:hypothetical protein
MSYLRPIRIDRTWLNQVFAAQAASKGGVVRRKISDVEAKVGRETFELEVRRRGFHLVEAGTQFIVICDTGHIRLIC